MRTAPEIMLAAPRIRELTSAPEPTTTPVVTIPIKAIVTRSSISVRPRCLWRSGPNGISLPLLVARAPFGHAQVVFGSFLLVAAERRDGDLVGRAGDLEGRAPG